MQYVSVAKYFKILVIDYMISVFRGFLKNQPLQSWDRIFIVCPTVGSSKVSVRLTDTGPFMNRDYRRLHVRDFFLFQYSLLVALYYKPHQTFRIRSN